MKTHVYRNKRVIKAKGTRDMAKNTNIDLARRHADKAILKFEAMSFARIVREFGEEKVKAMIVKHIHTQERNSFLCRLQRQRIRGNS